MMDNDVVRILITTDNHLGYLEKDPVRSEDSFAAFEEVSDQVLINHNFSSCFILCCLFVVVVLYPCRHL